MAHLVVPWYFGATFTSSISPGAVLELPNSHRIPLSWLAANAGESIRYRTLAELTPPGLLQPEQLEVASASIAESPATLAVVKKQKDTGIWGQNLLGLAPSAKDGIKEVGTIPQYRRLAQLGLPEGSRPFKLADRVLFRLLSRDEDPALLHEYQKLVKAEPTAGPWARETLREAATCALAETGHADDPRVRGAAHRIASAVSSFLRSPLAEKPFVRAGSSNALNPEAYPPSWYSVAMVASMPSLQRERAGFAERLGHYLAQPAPRKAFVVKMGRRTLKPAHLLLGEPIAADARGNAKDIPLALHYIELLARMGSLQWAPVASKVLARLVSQCDEQGVWRPAGLRSLPKATHKIAWHMFPLEHESKTFEGRSADVTFRLALIAKLLNWELQYT
ncbi:MAG TPA: hypothetical protein VFS94_01310 [Gemmatimonadales bacterium]|nr:hypothetical protein [Gemmatimonadales bacterium]